MTMKKVMMSLAIVAMMVAAVACGNNAKKAEQAPEEVTETVEETIDTTAAGQVDTTVAVEETVEEAK